MKILVVCQYYHPENFQITPICEALVDIGHEVTVVTGLPNYPMGIIPNEYRKGHRNEIINGVHVLRCNEIGRRKGAFFLALNYFSYVYSASKMVLKLEGNFDVVFVYQLSPILMALPAIKYAQKHNKPIFLYCCDIWPESMKIYINNEYNPIFKLVKQVSRKIYNSADKIACQSISFIPYLKRVHNISDEKLTYIPAFADEIYLTQDFTHNNDNTINFVFLGNLGIAQNLISVLKAVEKIRNIPNFKVHFVGDGTVFNDMRAFVIEHKLEDIVVFYGQRPVEEMLSFYKLADACIVSLQANNEIGFTLPSKIQGYMAAGKPIIGMINGSTQDVIKEARCGICVNAGDVDAFANAMKDFMANREKYKDFGNNAREYFKENFRKKTFVNRIEKELGDLVNAKNAFQNSFI